MQVIRLLGPQVTKHFLPKELELIDANWHNYSEISFSRSTTRQLREEAAMVLAHVYAKIAGRDATVADVTAILNRKL